MKQIQSPDNPVYKKVQKLRRRKAREEEGLYLIEGIHLMEEAIKTGVLPETVLFRESFLNEEEGRSLLRTLGEQRVSLSSVADGLFDKLSDTDTPQGILSLVPMPIWTEARVFGGRIREGCSNVLVLDRIQDPGNMGTMLRTADAAGYLAALVLKGSVDVFSPKVIRAAAGSVFRLPILFAEGPEKVSDICRRRGLSLLASTPYCDQYYDQVNMGEKVALVIGNEAGGVCGELLDAADRRIKLPMKGSVESLNAAVAAGILMYESGRQRRTKR